MGKKLILVTFLLLFSLGIVSSAPPMNTENFFIFEDGYTIVDNPQNILKQNQDYQVNFFLYNTSNGKTLDNSTVNCSLFIAGDNGEVLYQDDVDYFEDGHWGKNVSGTVFSNLGFYGYGISCQDTDGGGAISNLFQVTYTGKDLSTSQSILYGFFLTLLVLIFISCFVGMNFLPAKNEIDEEGRILSITYLKYFRNVLAMAAYFLFIGINYITSSLAYAFLGDELVADTLFMIFQVSFGLAPIVVIVWLVWIIVSMFHDKQFQKLLNRGMFPGNNF